MAYTQNDINNLIAILQVGQANAQTAFRIEQQMNQQHGFPITGNQVTLRSLISFTIQNGHLIKSSTSNPAGYWTEIKTIYGQLEQELGYKIEPAPDKWDRLFKVYNIRHTKNLKKNLVAKYFTFIHLKQMERK
jgi:hypothetical protein